MATGDKRQTERFTSEWTDGNRARARALVDEFYDEEFLRTIGDSEAVIRSEFPAIAWREFFLGCLPTDKQCYLVYEEGEPFGRDRDVILGLNKQIKDEYKHAKIFTNYLQQFGVDVDLATYEASDEIIAACRSMVDRDRPHFIAAGFQCATEIRAAFMVQNLATYIEADYPSIAATLKQHVVADEGDHVHVGRMIMERFGSPDEFDAMKAVAEDKFEKVERSMERRHRLAMEGA